MTSSNSSNYRHITDIHRFYVADYVSLCLTLGISCAVGFYYSTAVCRRRKNCRLLFFNRKSSPLPCFNSSNNMSTDKNEQTVVQDKYPQSATSAIDEFLLAGRRMSVLPVSLSLFVSWLSAISFIGDPVEVYNYGAIYAVIGLGYCIGILPIAHLFGPYLFRLKLTSLFEFLEQRFSHSLRVTCSVISSFGMMLPMGAVLYAPSLALSQVSGIDIWLSIVIVGTICMFYTTLGGIRAVVWADTIQFFVMTTGLVAVVIQGCIRFGGPAQIWETAQRGGRLNFNNPNPLIRSTFWTYLIGGFFRTLNPYLASQIWVQRYCTLPTSRDVKIAIYLNIPLYLTFVGLFAANGLILYAYFAGCDPVSAGRVKHSDQMIPLMAIDLLSFIPGFPGIYLGTLFSASLSTMSSAQSSITANLLKDVISPVYRRLLQSDMTDSQSTTCAKAVSFLLGIVNVGLALILLIIREPTVFHLSMALTQVTLSPIAGLFAASILFSFLRLKHVAIGYAVGLVVSAWLMLGTLITGNVRHPKLPVSNGTCLVTNSYGMYFESISVGTSTSSAPSFADVIETSGPPSTPVGAVSSIGQWSAYYFSPVLYPAVGAIVTFLTALLASVCTDVLPMVVKRLRKQLLVSKPAVDSRGDFPEVLQVTKF